MVICVCDFIWNMLMELVWVSILYIVGLERLRWVRFILMFLCLVIRFFV